MHRVANRHYLGSRLDDLVEPLSLSLELGHRISPTDERVVAGSVVKHIGVVRSLLHLDLSEEFVLIA